MKKLLVVCGQTGTGKTSLAFYLADILGGELVSADSRQIYRNLNIGTGKDVLKDDRYDPQGFYDVGGIKIWGYDLVGPKAAFSVGRYLRFAKRTIADILKRKKLPILVGGTGLYIKAVVDGIPTAFVPRNVSLRRNLAEKKPQELFELLAQLDPIKAGSLNTSDRANPRRLVRAIEIATWGFEHKKLKPPRLPFFANRPQVLFIGLTARREFLAKKIEARVDKRIAQGLEKEVRDLLSSGVNWKHQSMSSFGYREWRDYFEGKKSRDEVITTWKKEEKRYAKRQLTWFKKDERINWFDTSNEDFVRKVEQLVKKWYSSN
jgi:tRNA dimethylallyltransferase